MNQSYRILENRGEKYFVEKDIRNLIQTSDISNPDTFLVLNGGTGTGKTRSVMKALKEEIQSKTGRPPNLILVESRTKTTEQIKNIYNEEIETIGGINVVQRATFMNMIKREEVEPYNWVVIDECHGLFSEASFAEDAEFIANWIKTNRNSKTHIIFVTANDEYFDRLSRKFFPEYYSFIYLFPDFTHYVNNTYVKEVQFIKTSAVEKAIEYVLPRLKKEKGLIYFKKATDVVKYRQKLLKLGIRAEIIVSTSNETRMSLSHTDQELFKEWLNDYTNDDEFLSVADFCAMNDVYRLSIGKESLSQALIEEHIPEDIDVLIATDTLQEGISIHLPEIDFIIIEGYTEVDVRQKLGRYRGNLNLLYIIFDARTVANRFQFLLKTFQELQKLFEENNQIKLAELYGAQEGSQMKIKFLRKDSKNNTYYINEPAYLNCLDEYHQYLILKENPEKAIQELYSFPLMEGAPKLLSYNDDIRDFNLKQKVIEIAERWIGIPLKGPAQLALIQEFQMAGITDSKRCKIDSFKKCMNALSKYNIPIEEKQATKADLSKWPQFLSRPREKFKIISKNFSPLDQ